MFSACLEWYEREKEDPNNGELLLNRVPDCCQIVDGAEANRDFVRDTHDLLVSFFNPGAAGSNPACRLVFLFIPKFFFTAN